MEKTFQLKGPAAVLGILLAVAIVGVRLASLGSNGDPALEAAVRQELFLDSTGAMSADIQRMRETGDYSGAPALAGKTDPKAIDILKLGTSGPLLSWSSNRRVIVHVRYRLPGDTAPSERYLEFRHGAIGNGWQYRRRSSALGYYLNLF